MCRHEESNEQWHTPRLGSEQCVALALHEVFRGGTSIPAVCVHLENLTSFPPPPHEHKHIILSSFRGSHPSFLLSLLPPAMSFILHPRPSPPVCGSPSSCTLSVLHLATPLLTACTSRRHTSFCTCPPARPTNRESVAHAHCRACTCGDWRLLIPALFEGCDVLTCYRSSNQIHKALSGRGQMSKR